MSGRYYEESTYPLQDPSALPAISDLYAAGWTTISSCDHQLTTILPQNRSAGALPCSLNNTDGLLNVAYAPRTYATLNTGISQITSNFNQINATQQGKGELEGSATDKQVITHIDPATKLSHSMLFYPDASMEVVGPDGSTNYGIDYVAGTTSMVTQVCALQEVKNTPHPVRKKW